MKEYDRLCEELRKHPRRWLVTGVAGFIGSHLLERLLTLGQQVTGLDNFATGTKENLNAVRQIVGDAAFADFQFIEGDIRSAADCRKAMVGVQHVLHQAALGSVPRSIDDPLTTNEVNVGGFLEILLAARESGEANVVYASSSAVYGDISDSVKVEGRTGKPLSPYAASKAANELYAHSFSSAYRLSCVGLRYFNVFGSRQSPEGPYAAVIPRWLALLARAEVCHIFGDGETSRDFCFVQNVVQANILAACAKAEAGNQVYNIAVGESTTLNQLYKSLAEAAETLAPTAQPRPAVVHAPFRTGDVRHSLADIGKARELLGYAPQVTATAGIEYTVRDFFEKKDL
jgi:UDP-N-acetylglucosamine 4-epimerase